MSDPAALALALASTEATEACGAAFARCLPGLGSGPALVYLEGDLGAGKTTWVRGFLRALGIEGPIRSPSYTLLETYSRGELTVVHLDLYRLQEPRELELLGLRELHRPWHLWLVEWPDRGGRALPEPDLRIHLEADASEHRLRARGVSGIGSQWVQAVALSNSSKT